MVTTRDHIDRSTSLGANLLADGVAFRIWAPLAQQVFALTGGSLAAAQQAGFVPAPGDALFPLGDGTWGGFVSGLGEGTLYRLWIVGTGSTGLKRDPRARQLGTEPSYPNCDCVVRSPATFPWHDDGFRPPDFRDLILYQLHIGVYYAVDAAGHDKRTRIGKFLDLLDRVQYLRDLGVNAVQLLPIQEFPSESSRGYNGLDLFSPEMDYEVHDPAELQRYLGKANALLAAHGRPRLTLAELEPGPNQLKCVIDLLHLNGIATFFDLVFNHAGPGFNDQSLWFLDRQPYGDDNRSLYLTDHQWVGGRVFAFWNQDVRQFLIDNAKECIEEYHLDGIRYDEVSVIDNNGGGGFSQDLSGTVRFVKPEAIQIAEYWNSDRAAAVRPVPSGLGFDAAWSDRVRDGVRAAIVQASRGTNAFVDMAALSRCFETPDGFGLAWKAVNALEDHDTVFADRDQRIAALADPSNARSWFARSRARVATGLLMIGRGIPMLFMGQEILEDKQWNDDVKFHPQLLIWWDGLAIDQAMRDHLRFCQDLVWLRRSQPALRSESLRVSRADSVDRVLAVHRWIEGEGRDVFCVANLQELNRFQYRVGLPGAGTWREVFNSDFYEGFPNPGVVGNGGSIVAGDPGWDDMPASAAITIPANGFVLFAR